MVPAVIQAKIESSQPSVEPLGDEGVDQPLIIELSGSTLSTPSLETPDQILLGSLRDGRLRVRSPIKVEFTAEGEHIIAEAVDFNEFGFGNNTSEALIDLQRAVAELYLTLEKEQDRLGKDLQGVWVILQEKIHKL